MKQSTMTTTIDLVPGGTFRGGEEIPAGTFHGKHCTNCGGYITYPERFKVCPMCRHTLN